MEERTSSAPTEQSGQTADQQQLVELGSATVKTARGTIHTLTIAGQIEGHQLLPETTKSTASPPSPWCWGADTPSGYRWRWRPRCPSSPQPQP